MKKGLKFTVILSFVIALFTCFSLQGWCASETYEYVDADGNVYTYSLSSKNEVYINQVKLKNENTYLVIPAEIKGNPVVEIESKAFYECSGLKSVTLPDSIKKIGKYAFCRCENLESLNLPNSLEEIGSFAFAYCYKLTSDLYIPESVKLIDSYAFEEDIGITSLVFDENSKCRIEKDAFTYTSIESITVPKGAECGPAFKLCLKLKTADIQAKPLVYETYYIDGSKKVVTKHMPAYMFDGCESLETVHLPEFSELYAGMFDDCFSLKSVTFGGTLSPSVIPEKAFYNCKTLKKSNININFSSVTQVETDAFYGCENMDFDMQNDFPVLSTVRDNAFYGCKLLHNLSLENISYVGDYAFAYCNSLDSVELPDGDTVFHVGDYAFAYCDSLRSIEIPDGRSLSRGTFMYCKGIETVTFSGQLNINPKRTKVFHGCNGIKTIILDNNFKMSGSDFLYFNSVIDVYSLPLFEEFRVGSNEMNLFSSGGVLYRSYIDEKSGKELVEIVCYPHARQGEFYSTAEALSGRDCFVTFGKEAFRETKYLKKLEITQDYPPAYQEQYDFTNMDGSRQFYKSSVEEIVFLKKGLEYIDPSMFESSNIREIDLSGVITVDQGGFKNCKNLKDVDLSKCEYIYDGAFEGCEKLTNLQLINAWEIGAEAFRNCTELNFVNFGINACTIGSDAFKNCPKVSFYCDEDSKAYTYAVENNIPIISINILFYNNNAAYEYTGSEIRPALIVAINGMVLTENKDYTVECFDNIKYVPNGYSTLIVHFIGDFEGLPDAYRQFYIVRRSIESATVEYVKDNVYDGEEIKPAVVVILDGKILTEGVDYEIVYQSGTDTGTMLFTVTGKGNYTGKIDCYYNIVRRDIAEAEAQAIPNCVYTGSEVCPVPVLKWNGFTLVFGEDYEVRSFENVNSGLATAVIYGKGNFCGTLRVRFKIFGKDISEAEVSAIPDMEYTGEELKPAVTVVLDGKTLTEGTDYTVSYADNTDSGDTAVIINGTGNYSGTLRRTFRIYKNSVYSFTVFSETQMTETYDGTPLKPEMEVYFGTDLLTEGVDYTVRLENNISAGTGVVTVCGIGRFEGERSFTFTILPCAINENDITVSGNMEYNGDPVEPTITVTKNGQVLENGKDYAVSYKNNDKVGTAYVIVEGLENYCNSVELEYEIYSAPEEEKPPVSDPDDENKPLDNEKKPSEGNENTQTPSDKEDNNDGLKPNDIPKDKQDKNGNEKIPAIPNTDYESRGTALRYITVLTVLIALCMADDKIRRKFGRKTVEE